VPQCRIKVGRPTLSVVEDVENDLHEMNANRWRQNTINIEGRIPRRSQRFLNTLIAILIIILIFILLISSLMSSFNYI
jgi:hypothetical protein